MQGGQGGGADEVNKVDETYEGVADKVANERKKVDKEADMKTADEMGVRIRRRRGAWAKTVDNIKSVDEEMVDAEADTKMVSEVEDVDKADGEDTTVGWRDVVDWSVAMGSSTVGGADQGGECDHSSMLTG